MWPPAMVSAHASFRQTARKTNACWQENRCKYCIEVGHFGWECQNPHDLCWHIQDIRCRVYPSHIHFQHGLPSCPHGGRKYVSKGKGKAKETTKKLRY